MRGEQLLTDLDANGTSHVTVPPPLTALLLINVDRRSNFNEENKTSSSSASRFSLRPLSYRECVKTQSED